MRIGISLMIMLMAAMPHAFAGETKEAKPEWTEQQIWDAICDLLEAGKKADDKIEYSTERHYRQCNRVLKKTVFTDEDRFNKAKSLKMFVIYTRNYCKTSDKKWSPELAVRFWYGGRYGDDNDRTVKDWERVLKQLEKRDKEAKKEMSYETAEQNSTQDKSGESTVIDAPPEPNP